MQFWVYICTLGVLEYILCKYIGSKKFMNFLEKQGKKGR